MAAGGAAGADGFAGAGGFGSAGEREGGGAGEAPGAAGFSPAGTSGGCCSLGSSAMASVRRPLHTTGLLTASRSHSNPDSTPTAPFLTHSLKGRTFLKEGDCTAQWTIRT